TGAEITGAAGQVLLDGLPPNAGLTAVTVNALEDQTGTSATWSVTAYAVCSNPVDGLERTAATSVSNSTGSRLVTASCSPGKSVIGAGGTINSSNGQVVLDALFPQPDLTGATIAAFEDDTGLPGNWSVTAVAICAADVQVETDF